MMNQLVYRLTYWLRMTNWDSDETPREVQEAFQVGNIPPGAALDLGCGTGTNTIFMAKHGRRALGLDFVPEAIKKARSKARLAGVDGRAQFQVADVTRLNEMDLPQSGFALDMGCFHGLDPDGQRRYAEGLAKTMVPGGRYMLYTLDPRKEAGFSFGMRSEAVQAIFAPWFDIVRVERGSFWSRQSTWFWLVRKAENRPNYVSHSHNPVLVTTPVK
jgi:cyclopropane fatty-acyl-phospholipid synthase-like methyltransferase